MTIRLFFALKTHRWANKASGMIVGAYFHTWQTINDYTIWKVGSPVSISNIPPTAPPPD